VFVGLAFGSSTDLATIRALMIALVSLRSPRGVQRRAEAPLDVPSAQMLEIDLGLS